MRIDIGHDGRILGTKRVSPNGQISGFTEYAGLDVLVILPGGHVPVVKRDAKDLLAEAETLVRERMELAFREYRHLRQRFPTPEAAAKTFLRRIRPSSFQGLVGRADAWIREQIQSRNGERRAPHAKRTSARKGRS